MSARPLRRQRIIRAAVTPGLIAAAVGMLVTAWHALWSHLGKSELFFGGDLVAYLEAAKRLIATGSPYHERVLTGPVENTIANVPIGYFYPPPLAQIFVPLVDVAHQPLALVWFGLQVGLLAGLTPVLWRRSGGEWTPRAAAGLLFVFISSEPLAFALFGGNVSGWIAIGIAIILLARGSTIGVTAAAMAVIKSTPVPLLVAAFSDRTARRSAAVTTGVAALISIAMAPNAWASWLRALPNIARNPPAVGTANLSPAAMGAILGWPEAGAALGAALAIGFTAAGVLLAWRFGLTLPAIAASSMAYMFASPTFWDHHAAAAVPLIVAAWPASSRPVRLVIAAYVTWGVLEWTRFGYMDIHQLGTLVLLLAMGVVLVVPPVRRALEGFRGQPAPA